MRQKTDPTRMIDTHVGKQLRLLRASRGLTQDSLASKLGISYQQLHKYETGSNSISASRLYELSKFLNVSPDVFFEDIEILPHLANETSEHEQLLSRNQMGFLKYLSTVPDHKRTALLGFIRTMADIES